VRASGSDEKEVPVTTEGRELQSILDAAARLEKEIEEAEPGASELAVVVLMVKDLQWRLEQVRGVMGPLIARTEILAPDSLPRWTSRVRTPGPSVYCAGTACPRLRRGSVRRHRAIGLPDLGPRRQRFGIGEPPVSC
jgi:hypothetical protein